METRLVLIIAACAACGSAPGANRPPSDPSDGDHADPCDMCVLQRSDDSVSDDDGCPGPDLHMTEACNLSVHQEALLSEVAPELVANAHLTTVRLVSGRAACANAVQVALQRRGLPSSRIEVVTRAADPGVAFEVGAWDGKRCDGPP